MILVVRLIVKNLIIYKSNTSKAELLYIRYFQSHQTPLISGFF